MNDSMPTVGVLHPGQMGVAIAAAAAARGHEILWCSAGRSPATVDRAAAAGLTPVPDLAGLLAASDVVLSICPPASAGDVAGEVAAAGFGGLYVEANAISVERVEGICRLLERAGARAVDGAIIGPPPGEGRSARLYLAGEPADLGVVAGIFATGPVEAVSLSGGIGAASALKMAFAGYQKAARTLAGVAHALAGQHGVTAELLAESRRMPGNQLADPDYLPGVAARAWRWAPEMHEVADTLAAAGLPTELARAAADVLRRWEPDRDNWSLTLEQTLSHLAAPTHAVEP
ncbi:DUF1932 domain-containing protein [Pseudonocardia bannensis]|nr:NAD(P)-dependent oxidoreductase [Pseudonocardia bannensis]